MATSEYIPHNQEESGAAESTQGAGSSGRSGWLRFSMFVSLPAIVSDVLALFVAFMVAYALRAFVFTRIGGFWGLHLGLGNVSVYTAYFALFAVAYVAVAHRYGLYSHALRAPMSHELRMAAQACLVSGLLLAGLLFLVRNLMMSRTLLVLFIVCAMGALFIDRFAGRSWRRVSYKRGVFTRHIAIVGSGHLSLALYRHIRSRAGLGYLVRGFVLPRHARCVSGMQFAPVLGSTDDLHDVVRRHFIDEIVLADGFPRDEVLDLLEAAREIRVDVRAVAGYYNDLAPNADLESIGAFPVVSLHHTTPRFMALAFKRAGDFVLSIAALLIASPVMLAIALAIKLEGDGGSILYKSNRIGRHGVVFPCFKFRTMVPDAEKRRKSLAKLNERDGVLFKITDDPRITKVGRYLRKYSLDELPQFLNVLRGEMSLVGPRPPLAHEVEQYKLEHMRRLEVLPGVTGLWQVEARHDPSFARYIALDTAYVENWSFWLDLKILLRTVDVVIRGTGS